ncbi:PREDICTED: uncharacterized protein LOC109341536 [Lupinus angustifolius]|uniref:uncharacterized protein LOC109341536 n=1 Tax=Lupinus angustifolius TaxID=3871 RepID=UPI00092F0FB0|nr:PREDICTED: uncharacterized protein LOC109341536 [Lupinus angustifolius]XP_019435025.1 PREDICTED: uncharacterized protein LOC109341536 [Lupinus angustifolius]
MGKMYNKSNKKKQAASTDANNGPLPAIEEHMDMKTIMKDIQDFSNSHMSWKERKKIEDRKVVSLGGKPPKNQRLPLSVARPMMKKQKEREQKMLQEGMILGRFGGKLANSNKKRPTGKHKPEDRGLKSSEGHFRNGVLNVGHLLSSEHGTRTNMSKIWKKKGGDKKGLW